MCAISTMLGERGLVAVDAAHYANVSARAKAAAPQAVLSSAQSGELMPCSPFGPSCNCETCNPAHGLNVSQPAPQAVQPAAPNGWKRVPITLTADMEHAASINNIDKETLVSMWQYLLAVAPAHPAEGVPAVNPEDAAALLEKYRKLCIEIGRGDSYHLKRIEAAIAALATPLPAPQAMANFESWAKTYGGNYARHNCGPYDRDAMKLAGMAWKACSALAATQPAAQGQDARDETEAAITVSYKGAVKSCSINTEQMYASSAPTFYAGDRVASCLREIDAALAAQAKQGGA